MSDDIVKARIRAEIYPDSEGKLRWRIRSAARGRRVVADSAESYSRKADAFRGLLLATGGKYVQTFRTTAGPARWAYEQGSILRRTPYGPVEDIFVEYSSHAGGAR